MAARIGEPAPDFALLDGDRQTVTLEQFRGRSVVLVFYIKAFTGGCRNELQAFRDLHREFVDANAEVLGVSVDTFMAVGQFGRALSLNFPMLSDFPEQAASKAYSTYNPEREVSRRVTFVIDAEGILRAQIVSDDDMTRHADQALVAVQQLHNTAS